MLNNKGFSTAIALIITAIILAVIAGLLPAATNMLHMTKIDQNGEIAQAVAEAGAKRVLAEFYEDINDDLTIHDYNIPQRVTTDSDSPIYTATYTTTHTHASGTNNYTIISTGRYNNSERTVRVDVQAKTKETADSWNSFMYDKFFFAFAEGKIDLFAGLWGGNIYSKSHIDLLNCIAWEAMPIYACPENNVRTILGLRSLDPQSNLLIKTYNYVNNDAGIYNLPDRYIENARKLAPEWAKDSNVSVSTANGKKTYKLLRDKVYPPGERLYIDGNLIIDGDISREFLYLTLKLSRPGQLEIFVDGDLTIQNSACIGDYIEQNPNKQILLIVRGNVFVNKNAGLDYVTLISFGNITFKSSDVNFFGAMQAKGNIIAEPVLGKVGSILKYKRSAIKPFRDIVTIINSPPGNVTPAEFKILRWH